MSEQLVAPASKEVLCQLGQGLCEVTACVPALRYFWTRVGEKGGSLQQQSGMGASATVGYYAIVSSHHSVDSARYISVFCKGTLGFWGGFLINGLQMLAFISTCTAISFSRLRSAEHRGISCVNMMAKPIQRTSMKPQKVQTSSHKFAQ